MTGGGQGQPPRGEGEGPGDQQVGKGRRGGKLTTGLPLASARDDPDGVFVFGWGLLGSGFRAFSVRVSDFQLGLGLDS